MAQPPAVSLRNVKEPVRHEVSMDLEDVLALLLPVAIFGLVIAVLMLFDE